MSAGGGDGRPAKNRPTDFVDYQSREAGAANSGPRILVSFDDETQRSFAVAADATIIGYLPTRNLGGFPRLSINMSDSNRVLLRFDPLRGSVRKAELIMKARRRDAEETTAFLPRAPFALGVFEVKEPWNELQVSWDTEPRSDERAESSAIVDPSAAQVRLDVTRLARRLADPSNPKHGWLVKVLDPLEADGPTPGTGAKVERALLGLFAWASSVPDAVRQAHDEGKLVLACVRFGFSAQKTTYLEQMLLTSVLADPDVLGLIRERFVPVRVNNPRSPRNAPARKPARGDPLFGLGGSEGDFMPTALVVSNGDTVLARLANMGTFDRDLTLRFLIAALDKASLPRGEAGPWTSLARGQLAEAERLFARMDSRQGRYGLARVASLRRDHATALRYSLPLARSDGLYQQEAGAVAGRALARLHREAEAIPFLRAAASRSSGSQAAEAGYELGCALYREGNRAEARKIWEDVAKRSGDPSAVRAKARLEWPEAVAMYENRTAFDLAVGSKWWHGTEVDRSGDDEGAVRRGIDYLLSQQAPEGWWTSASQAVTYRAGITALVARSLHLWSLQLGGERGVKARLASERATGWLVRQLDHVDRETFNSFGAAYLLDYFLDLEETNAAVRGDVAKAVQILLAGQCPNGGWSYDFRFGTSWKGLPPAWPRTDKGRIHSVNTGPALLALARAKQLGHAVDPGALERGRKVLLAMRGGPGEFTYTYPVPIIFKTPDESIGRAAVCEHALGRLGASAKEDMELTIERFMRDRRDLRKTVKLTESWAGPHSTSSYFYFFAYDHAARAIAEHAKDRMARLGELRDDILRVAEVDGTWVDFEAIGKPYGTAMALHILFLACEAHDRRPRRQ
jgi:hypothetical protein